MVILLHQICAAAVVNISYFVVSNAKEAGLPVLNRNDPKVYADTCDIFQNMYPVEIIHIHVGLFPEDCVFRRFLLVSVAV